MDRQKVFNIDKLKEENRIRHEKIELEKFLVIDKRFLSSYTKEEFIEYELNHIERITKKFLIKFLKKYGFEVEIPDKYMWFAFFLWILF